MHSMALFKSHCKLSLPSLLNQSQDRRPSFTMHVSEYLLMINSADCCQGNQEGDSVVMEEACFAIIGMEELNILQKRRNIAKNNETGIVDRKR